MKIIIGVIAVGCMLATTAQAQTPGSNLLTNAGPYSGTPMAVPGIIEAELFDNGGENVGYHDTAVANEGGDFRTSEEVGIEICTDSGGGYNVGWTEAGEWLKYTVDVASTGDYTITSRVAAGGGTGAFHIEVDDVDVTGSISVADTGGWQIWTDIVWNVPLSSGEQVVKIVIETGGININYLEFVAVGGPVFATDPITKANATEDVAYTGQTVAGAATNVDSDPLSYSLVPGGPAWLSVATNGVLSGTPGNADVGANSWTLQVSDDKDRTDRAELNITVIDWNLSQIVVDPASGPFAGGNLVAISGLEIGIGSDVTNVTVGGASVVITGSTSDRVTITIPSGLSSGVQDIVFNGSISLEAAYSVNPAGIIHGKSLATSLNLSSLNGTNGFVINGIDGYDSSGISVSGAGDVNGDGLDDLLIGAYRADPNGHLDAGESYVVYGSTNGFSAGFNLSSLNGTNGFVINGIDEFDYSGYSVSGAGDVNGDGLDDLLIGAYGANSQAGESYVVYGSPNGVAAGLNLSSLNGTTGFVINGIDGDDRSGYSVSGAGDVNGDGFDDLLIGAYGANSQAGESYVVYGSPNGVAAALNLSSLNGINGFVINGIDGADQSGYSVSGAGDVNGDGLGDLLIGAHRADPNGNLSAGESYVVYGSPNGFSAGFNLSSLNGTTGFVINGVDGADQSGYSVSGAGDVNGDGLGDLLLGAYRADPNGNYSAGESYVVYGSPNGVAAALNLSLLNGTSGFVINGIDGADQSGYSVSGAGDVNGDGLGDLLIGAYYADPNGNSYAGESYVVCGSPNGVAAGLNLSSLNGTNGFVINGINGDDRSGYPVSRAGDVNGDGLDDLLIGANGADPNGNLNAGESYVVYGVYTANGVSPTSGVSTGGYQVTITGSNLGDGSDITNVTLNGTSVTSIDSQSSTQLVVTVAFGTAGTGDVVVYSTSHGTTTKANAFTYF